MKEKLLIIIMSFLILPSVGQIVFCPAGAEWHYLFSLSPTNRRNEKVKYVRDSVIGNETFKVLAHKRFYNLGGVVDDKLTLVKQKGDTVFFRNLATQHTWQILYNYGTPKGGSWQTTVDLLDPNVPGTSTYTITVDSINFITLNSFNLKRLHVKYYYNATDYSLAQITERLGSDNFMFSYPSFNGDEFFDSFLCYADNSFGLKQFTNYSCDYSVGLKEIKLSPFDITIYPNPAKDKIVVESNIELKKITLINSLCQEAFVLNKPTLRQEIDSSHLPAGIYFLKVESKQGQMIFKIVKE